MAFSSTSSTVAIALEPVPIARDQEQNKAVNISNFDPTNPDTIIAASRLADSQVPEGGYGWVVIGACSVLTFWFVGTSYSWGVIQAALVKEKLSSPSTLSFVGSLTAAFIAILALVNARVIRKIGARNTALIGVLCLGGGGILSGFSTKNVGGLFVTTGVIMGIGCR
jgi:hypothetical protein